MTKAKLTLVDLILVGSTFCPVGYGEIKFDSMRAAKAWAKSHGYLIDLELTHALDKQGAAMDVYTKRVTSCDLQKAYLEQIG
jgi:hypothetical protein